jgi:YfiR/HmsC-like
VVIGVLCRNPFGDALQAAVRGETAHGRPLEIRQLRQLSEASSCHIVFISSSEEPRVREIVRALSGQAVLTVSDMDNFAREHGGMVRFVTVENKVTLRIHVERAKAIGLMIDSRLLRMAEIVRDE